MLQVALTIFIEIPNPVPKHDKLLAAQRQIRKSRGGVRRGRQAVGAVIPAGVGSFTAIAGDTTAANDRNAHGLCPCVECVQRGHGYQPARGCAHLLRTLACVETRWTDVDAAARYEVPASFRLMFTILGAFFVPLPPNDATERRTGRFLVDATCKVADRPPGSTFAVDAVEVERSGVRFDTLSVDEVVGRILDAYPPVAGRSEVMTELDTPAARLQYLADEVLRLLAAHFGHRSSFAAVLGNKRELTCFLSYLNRSVAFWNSYTYRLFNQYSLRLGSILLEEMLQRCDTNGDGELNFEEFYTVMTKKTIS